jgi:cytidylate kinase
MAIVTFNGPIGAGGNEIGLMTARLLNADYVDRLILAQAAKRIGSTVEVLEIKEQRKIALRDRLAHFFQSMLERSAMSGAGGMPYFNPGIETLLSEEYTDLAQEPLSAAQRLNDERFIEVTGAVIKDLSKAGDVVIIGRGSNIILKDAPGALHVGLVTPLEMRIKTIVEREHFGRGEAEKYVTDMEKARVIYFRKFFNVHPDDPTLYHMVLNMGTINADIAAQIVTHTAQSMVSSSDSEALLTG